MPNPWDRGSARLLAEMGFDALGTTSVGHGRAIGKDDQEVTRDELVQHVRELASIVSVPLSVDSERLFPEADGGISQSVGLLAEAGAAGVSIEDYNPLTRSIEVIDVATAKVAKAVKAAAPFGLVVTARADNHIYGVNDLDDTIARLRAYREAGADVLYAPGLTELKEIVRVVKATNAPINVLALEGCPSIETLASSGVRRISSGGGLFNSAAHALRTAASALQRG